MSDFLYWFKTNGMLFSYFVLMASMLVTGALTFIFPYYNERRIRVFIVFSVVWLVFTFILCLFKGSTQILR
jgi:hypothetical protein